MSLAEIDPLSTALGHLALASATAPAVSEGGSSSWQPVDLVDLDDGPPPRPTLLASEDGERALVYAGKRHLVIGKPEAAKSWFCLAVCLDAIRRLGQRAAYFDFDLMGAREGKRRLRSLGASDSELRRMLFVEPDCGFDASAASWWTDALAAGDLGVAVFDAQNPGLELHGLNPNSDEDISRFQRHVIGHFHRAGVTTLICDHLPKDREAPREYAINSQRKLAGADVCFRLELSGVPLQRGGKPTSVTVEAMKDRPGGLDRSNSKTVGRLRLTPGADGAMHVAVVAAAAAADGELAPTFRPTFLMERTSRYLEALTQQASQRDVEAGVPGKREAKRAALQVLVDEGYVTRVKDGQAWMHRSERPYREASDPLSDQYEEGAK